MTHPSHQDKDLGRLITQLFFPDFFPKDHSQSWSQQQQDLLLLTHNPNPNKFELLMSELTFSFQVILRDVGLGKHRTYEAVRTEEEGVYEVYDAPTSALFENNEEDRRPSLSPTDLSSSIRSLLQKDDDETWMSPKAERKIVNEDGIDHEFYFDLSHLDEE